MKRSLAILVSIPLAACTGTQGPSASYSPRSSPVYSQPAYAGRSAPAPRTYVVPAPAAPAPRAVAMPRSGAFAWEPSLQKAQQDARASGRLVFVEAGREACGNCMALFHKVIPDPSVSPELGAVAVGYFCNIDVDNNQSSPEFQLLQRNLPYATILPLAGWMTPDMHWVHGFSGHTSVDQFRGDIARAKSLYVASIEADSPTARRAMADVPPASLPATELEDVASALGDEAAATPVASAPAAKADSAAAPTPATPAAPATPAPVAAAPAVVPQPAPESAPPATEAPPVAATPTGPAPVPAPAPGDAWVRDALRRALGALNADDVAGARAVLAEIRAHGVSGADAREVDKGEVAIWNLRRLRSATGGDAARIRQEACRDLAGTVWTALFSC